MKTKEGKIMKKRILALILVVFASVNLFVATALAESKGVEIDYEKIYIDYFNNNPDKMDPFTGYMMTELNGDNVPEIFVFAHGGTETVNGEEQESHIVYNKMYTIKNGKVAEYSTQIDGNVFFSNYLPWVENEAQASLEPFNINETDEIVLVSYYIDGDGEGMIQKLSYDGEEISLREEEENLYSLYGYSSSEERVCAQLYRTSDFEITLEEALNRLFAKYAINNEINYSVSDWAIVEINEATEKGLIPEEMADDDLTEEITREEFAAISVNLLEKVTGREYQIRGGSPFEDIDNMDEYYGYIVKAYNASVTTGITANSFDAKNSITREQLATMLTRVIKSIYDENYTIERDGEYVLDIGDIKKFADDEKISDYAKDSVYYMNKHGVTKGVDEANFAPLATATKEQAILLSVRIYNSVEDLKSGVSKAQTKVNDDVIGMIGKTYKEVKDVWGASKGNIWIDGNLFKFGESPIYLAFVNEYDLDKPEPNDESVCYVLKCSLGNLITGLSDKEYTAEEFTSITGEKLEYTGVSPMDDTHGYSFEYKGQTIHISTVKQDCIKLTSGIFVKDTTLE